MYQNGTVEKFEGSDAFDVIEESLMKLQQDMMPPPEQPSYGSPIKSNNKHPPVNKSNQLFEPPSSISDIHPNENRSMKTKKKTKKTKNVKPIQQSLPQRTSIEDLDSESESDDQDESNKNTVQNFVIPDRPDDQPIKDTKHSSIMASAMQMQKMREQEESSNRRPQTVVAR
jgi:hypothetical protein